MLLKQIPALLYQLTKIGLAGLLHQRPNRCRLAGLCTYTCQKRPFEGPGLDLPFSLCSFRKKSLKRLQKALDLCFQIFIASITDTGLSDQLGAPASPFPASYHVAPRKPRSGTALCFRTVKCPN